MPRTPSSREKDRTKLKKIKRSIVASSFASVSDFQEKILSWWMYFESLCKKLCEKRCENPLDVRYEGKARRERERKVESWYRILHSRIIGGILITITSRDIELPMARPPSPILIESTIFRLKSLRTERNRVKYEVRHIWVDVHSARVRRGELNNPVGTPRNSATNMSLKHSRQERS